MMQYLRCATVGLLALWSARAHADDTPRWHVDISVHERFDDSSSTEGPESEVKKTHRDASFSILDDAAGTPEHVQPPTVTGSVTGAFAQSESTTTKTKYREGTASSDEQGAIDRSTATYVFSYTNDHAWFLDASVGFKSQVKSKTCWKDLVMHDGSCDSGTNDNTPGLAAHAGSDNGGKLHRTKDGFAIDWSLDEQGHHLTLRATLSVKTTSKYEAVLRPGDMPSYHRWMPEGPRFDGNEEDGNTLGVWLEIRDKQTHKPVKAKFSATYTLTTSEIKGWSMNTPAEDVAKTKPDLAFVPAKNAGKHVAADGKSMTVDNALGDDLATVSCRDWGAYGSLAAKVTIEGEPGAIDAQLVDDHGTATNDTLTIPEDRNANHIADVWEKNQHIYGDNKKANVDDEDSPAGMATRGDGYTLYEEYRGFWLFEDRSLATWAVAGKPTPKTEHTRLDPNAKDLLVIPMMSGNRRTYIRGALGYGAVTNIHVRIVDAPERLALLPGDHSWEKEMSMPRWANFNRPIGDHAHFADAQVAVRIAELPPHATSLGISPPVDGDGILLKDCNADKSSCKRASPKYMAPKDCMGAFLNVGEHRKQLNQWIDDLERGENANLETALQNSPLKRADVVAAARAHYDELLTRLLEFSTMHELGHNTGAVEHAVIDFSLHTGGMSVDEAYGKTFATGAKQCPQRYWHFTTTGIELLNFLAYRWDPTLSSFDAGPWHYCDENWPTMRLRQDMGQIFEARPSKR